MKPAIRLCQFSVTLSKGDAMSAQAIAIHRAAEAFGVESALFTFEPVDDMPVPVSLVGEYEQHANDVIVLHYGGRGEREDWVLGLPGRIYICYHNVTPARFFARIGVPWVEGLRRGRDSLPELAHLGGLADSDYNRQELIRAGFRDVHVIPLILDFDAMIQATQSLAAQEIVAKYQQAGVINWLHVGRIVPNKHIEDIIRAFYVYHTQINPNSRLFFAGTDESFETYSQPIHRWVERLGLQQSVIFTGRLPDDDQVAGLYRLADLYVCMSEHEGFCAPLVEAMVQRVPIIAYRSSAVKDTMGNAGVLLDSKDPALIAHIAHLLCSQAAYRQEIIAGQLVQAQKWHPDKARQALYEWLQTL
ncbi:MAG: glycosyltransferase [Thermoflexales bacterium]|nr:glycosyltransferase [Thermoflexales bacterium]